MSFFFNQKLFQLQNLGKLCGLMPNVKTTSSHLQLVVDLLSGMGEGEERGDAGISPALVNSILFNPEAAKLQQKECYNI